MRLPRPGLELGMELPGDEPRVVGQLDDLDQLLLRPDAGDPETPLREPGQVIVVDLVTVPVALLDGSLTVGSGRRAALAQCHRVQAEPHGATLVGDRAFFL